MGRWHLHPFLQNAIRQVAGVDAQHGDEELQLRPGRDSVDRHLRSVLDREGCVISRDQQYQQRTPNSRNRPKQLLCNQAPTDQVVCESNGQVMQQVNEKKAIVRTSGSRITPATFPVSCKNTMAHPITHTSPMRCSALFSALLEAGPANAIATQPETHSPENKSTELHNQARIDAIYALCAA